MDSGEFEGKTMNYTIRDPLQVQFTKAPAIAIAGESGSGKTESALRLARGYCGPGKRFLIVDTEEKRALYKKDRYQPWDWMDLQPPFSPENYSGALDAGKGYPAVVLDSGSHEYSSEGGLQDIAAEALEKLSKGDPARAEKLTALAWKDAKLRHKKMMNRLIRYPTLLIVCLRSEPKIKFQKDAQGKTQIVDMGFMPIAEKMFMYEMLVACQLHASNAGVPEHIKRLEPDLEPVFLAGKQIDERTGERLALWAQARKESSPPPQSASPDGVSLPSPDGAGSVAGPESAAAALVRVEPQVETSGTSAAPSAAAPTDEELVKDIEKRVKRKDFDSAFDLARGIQDHDLNVKTIARINKALAFVTAKAAVK
jgi:hypothetical protein